MTRGLRIKWQKTEMSNFRIEWWPITIDRYRFHAEWRGRFSSRKSTGQKGEMNESGHEALQSRVSGPV